MKIQYDRLYESKTGKQYPQFVLFVDGGYRLHFTYFPEKISINWSKGVQVNAGTSKKLALIINEWVISKEGETIHPGEILSFVDPAFHLIERSASQRYKEWQKEREKKKHEKNN